MIYDIVWQFKTANFRVALEVTPEESAPEDHFQFDEDVNAVRSGKLEWFCAKVTVYGPDNVELAAAYLGGCAYRSFDEFRRGDGYFPDMVREATAAARDAFFTHTNKLNAIRLRP